MDNQSAQNMQSLIAFPYHVFYTGMQFVLEEALSIADWELTKSNEKRQGMFTTKTAQRTVSALFQRNYVGNNLVKSVTEPEAGERPHAPFGYLHQ